MIVHSKHAYSAGRNCLQALLVDPERYGKYIYMRIHLEQ